MFENFTLKINNQLVMKKPAAASCLVRGASTQTGEALFDRRRVKCLVSLLLLLMLGMVP
jgi:hypothetical protein